MKFIDVYCMTRRTTLCINIETIVVLKHYIINQATEGCGIVVEGIGDDHGEVIVEKKVNDIKKMINNAV